MSGQVNLGASRMICPVCKKETGAAYATEHGTVCPDCWEAFPGGGGRLKMATHNKYPQYWKLVSGVTPDTGTPAHLEIDVYGILVAYNVTNPATAHAIKKLLRAGTDHNETLTDLQEAKDALDRAMEIERGKAW